MTMQVTARHLIHRTAKEVVRHALTRLAMHRLVDSVRSAKGFSVGHFRNGTLAARFGEIYDVGLWTGGTGDVPLSGTGSTLAATRSVREGLPSLLRAIGAETLLDVGCGDLTWMSAIDLGIDYIGVDVVESVVRRNIEMHGSARRRFYCRDAMIGDLPDADTVLCREVLFHLGFAEIAAVLRNVGAKRRRWLIATTDASTLFNADIRCGDYRVLNLRLAPFRFPEPDHWLDDSAQIPGRRLAVWSFDRLPACGR
ncbi:class I SAM-dependent methyltransferase [Rhodopseudomonas palustris]|uniref:Class I SAM-dependent methyltransferase n=2 Tax=Rhodopseudomonas palustris TaxID=1076 RepID=A0A323UNG7_RHOPL|nr:class I SAM-dependent methyltransferase [Rhodopseudomonas palustris]